MGFGFHLDSENRAGRMVYSHHSSDELPFYLVIDKASGRVVRRHFSSRSNSSSEPTRKRSELSELFRERDRSV